MQIQTNVRNVRLRGIRAAVAALSIIASSLAPLPAAAQGQVVARYGDWRVACDRPPGAQSEQCALIQDVAAEGRDNIQVTVIVLKTADLAATLLRVIVPLGVLLPFGLGLQIDGNSIGTVEFVRCFYPEGCLAELVIDDTLLAQLSEGTTATFVIFLTPEAGTGLPVSLDGFADGYNALP